MEHGSDPLNDLRAEAFALLFKGSLRAYGADTGACVEFPQNLDNPDAHYLELCRVHLFGSTPIGVYPHYLTAEGETVCRWGCVDFDEGDEASQIHAVNLIAVLLELGIVGWHEISRSKGSHVWVFAAETVPAALMRTALLAGCQIAQAPTQEINPKQAELQPGQVGNYVRLPYPDGWQNTLRRCMVEDTGEPIALPVFLKRADATSCRHSDLTALAKLYKDPTPSRQPRQEYAPSGWGVPAIVSYMVDHGPFEEGQDRSAWLWKLCCRMKDKGVPYGEARRLLETADERWGKFHDRPDGQQMLDRMLDKAWREA
jgi:hypothetical protein